MQKIEKKTIIKALISTIFFYLTQKFCSLEFSYSHGGSDSIFYTNFILEGFQYLDEEGIPLNMIQRIFLFIPFHFIYSNSGIAIDNFIRLSSLLIFLALLYGIYLNCYKTTLTIHEPKNLFLVTYLITLVIYRQYFFHFGLLPDQIYITCTIYLLWSVINNKIYLTIFLLITASICRQNVILLSPILFVIIWHLENSNKRKLIPLTLIPYIIFLLTYLFAKKINPDNSELLNNGFGVFYLMASGHFSNLSNFINFFLFLGMSLFYIIPLILAGLFYRIHKRTNFIIIALILIYIIQPIIGGPVSVGYSNAARHISTIAPFATILLFKDVEFKKPFLILIIFLLYSLFPPFNNLINNLLLYIFLVTSFFIIYFALIKYESKINFCYHSSKK